MALSVRATARATPPSMTCLTPTVVATEQGWQSQELIISRCPGNSTGPTVTTAGARSASPS
jgi:hypothetical protein